jgi:hypothetical protein
LYAPPLSVVDATLANVLGFADGTDDAAPP